MISGARQSPKKKPKDSNFTKVYKWLHLWLGLASGIIVFIVCVTGCIWVFNEEINAMLEPESRVEKQNKPTLTPSQLSAVAAQSDPDLVIANARYIQGRAVEVTLRNPHELEKRGGGTLLKVNPYTGKIISREVRKKGEVDFFRFILNGHRNLWLPREIGRPVVDYATLVFTVILITGLIWWYPKKWNKSTTDKSFKIKWGASFKRVNLDLHNVLGFYAMLFLLVIALTGMVFGIKWYSQGLYWVTTGGEKLKTSKDLKSDTLNIRHLYNLQQAMDIAWTKVIAKHPRSEGFYYSFPDTAKAKATIGITVYPTAGQFYNNQSYSFDQHSLKELKGKGVYDISFAKSGFGGKLRKMNYDIHIGSILGFPGKVLAFLAALIGASLPITGFLVWYGRKFKKKKQVAVPEQKTAGASPKPKLRIISKQEEPVFQLNTEGRKI
ncbi:MAG: PepSY-associated TM helix domain-containing protein [Pedobacter sp.]|uniref:PepSY-associated TM helix domain-containing protein n=1 Tax=Pedobacter sp. TaxID=1411316 RepID=UPI003394966A